VSTSGQMDKNYSTTQRKKRGNIHNEKLMKEKNKMLKKN
jgi:hypothetical protein